MANYYLYNKYNATSVQEYAPRTPWTFLSKEIAYEDATYEGYATFKWSAEYGLRVWNPSSIDYYNGIGATVYNNYGYSIAWMDVLTLFNGERYIYHYETTSVFGPVYSQGTLVTSNIEAQDGTYPNNGKHTDGYWYVRGSQISAPSLTTTTVASVTGTTATLAGNLTSAGNSVSVTRGVQWGATVTDNTKSLGVAGVGAFTHAVTGLSNGTLYYYRAYASNIAGTTYGTTYSFTTLSKPTVETLTPATNIKPDSATISGKVTAIGGATSTTYLQWGTSNPPTTSINKGTGGVATYTADLTGLEGDTTYYYRIYSTNSVGTTYGTVYSFKTKPKGPANLKTYNTNVAENIKSINGNLIGNVKTLNTNG